MSHSLCLICHTPELLRSLEGLLPVGPGIMSIQGLVNPQLNGAPPIAPGASAVIIDAAYPQSHQLIGLIRQSAEYQGLPVLVVGAFTEFEQMAPFLQLGADDVLPIPIPPNDLILRLRALLTRAQALRDLRLQSDRLGDVVQAVSVAGKSIMVVDALGHMVWANQGFEQLYGCTPEEYRRQVGDNLFASSLEPELATALAHCREHGEPTVSESLWRAANAPRRYISSTLTPILDPQGNLQRVIVVGSDMTSFREAERALGDKHDNLLSTMDHLEHANELLEQQRHEIEQQRASLEQEKAKTDALLQNILPFEVAYQLTKKGSYTPKIREVSVMFADFVGFSKMAVSFEDINEFLRVLGFYFEKFDEITSARFIEKIKTIGDCYMCVGGVPRQNKSHPFDTLLAALEIQRFVEEIAQLDHAQGKPVWRLRIGIHSGSVVAGVIGKKRFAYDVWGDTVNVASRMESSGEAGMVNISETTYERVKKYFQCTYRGKVPAKNIGDINMYFVERILPQYSDDEHGVRPNAEFRKVLASF